MRLRAKSIVSIVSGLLLLGVLGFILLTSPWLWSMVNPAQDLPDLANANLENGRNVFVASDCATCHQSQEQDDDKMLGGGRVLHTQFGAFHMPNISPHKLTGIGGWTLQQFDRAVREGVGPSGLWPDGKVLYPAFPYTSYQKLSGADVRDLYAYMLTLPAVDNIVPDHELKFPYSLRRGVGIWRLAFLNSRPKAEGPLPAGVNEEQFRRGQYLVEGAGHCAECHSPRGKMGNVVARLRYGGGPAPDGIEYFPNISPDATGIGFWSEASIFNYLKTGVSPIGRVAAGDMAEVIKNTSQLPVEDLRAMAHYLKNIAPVHKLSPHMPEPNRTDKIVMLDNFTPVAPVLPTSPQSAIAVGGSAVVVASKPFWLDQAQMQSGHERGKLLGGAQVNVAGHQDDRFMLVLHGWQLEDAPAVVYQSKGHRVMTALLDEEAAAAVKRGEPQQDADTGQNWLPVEVTLWTGSENLNASREAVWAYSSQSFEKACSACHVLPHRDHFTANQWVGTMKAMRRFTSFNDDQYRLILSYLQNHSKDLNPAVSEVQK